MKKNRVKSAIWDNMHYYNDEYSDRLIRTVIQFDGELEMDVLIRAFNKAIDLVPIIKSKWVTGWLNNYWEIIQNFDIRDYITITEDLNTAENFMIRKIDIKASAQIKVLIYRHDGRDNMRIMFNHMCFDASSLKDFFSLLSRYYSGLKQNEEFTVTDFINGDRQLSQLFKNFSLWKRLKLAFKKSSLNENNSKLLTFPFEENAPPTEKVFLKSSYDESFFIKIKDKSKKIGVTLNDVFLAAFGRAMYDISPGSNLPLIIHCTYNLRKYLKGGKTAGLTNMSSGIVIPFTFVEGESFNETVARIHRQMDEFKSDYPGLWRLEFLRFVSLAMKFPALRKSAVKKGFANPIILFSNVGIVTEDMVNYSGLNIEDFYIIGSIKNQPYFSLSLITFRNRLNMFTSVNGSKKDLETTNNKLNLIKSYLESYIE